MIAALRLAFRYRRIVTPLAVALIGWVRNRRERGAETPRAADRADLGDVA